MKKVFQIIVIVFLAATVFKPLVAQGQFFFAEKEKVGKPIQGFTLDLLSGDQMSLDEFRQGQRALVFFWATWCPHCREALGELSARRDELEGMGIKVALVDIGESPQVVGKYFERNDIDMDVFLDVDTVVGTDYGIVGVPTYYFVDEAGIVANILHGFPEDFEAAFAGE